MTGKTGTAAAPIVCFGEMLLRLTAPGREKLLQSGRLDVHVGGAEANVAVGLASLGHTVRMGGAVPDNPLGRGAVAALRAHGVDCRGVRHMPGRMGLYFVNPGAGCRASDILYDRAGSAFAEADPEDFDWPALLDGAGRLHLSGITAALGARSAQIAISAAEAAVRQGVPVSFDCNYRAKLWDAWDSNPREILSRIIDAADILFGSHRDIGLLLDKKFSDDGRIHRRQATEAAFDAFPRLQAIASTGRIIENTDTHRISARCDTRDQGLQSREVTLSAIVDRIGTGDAFAAGILHGMENGLPSAEALEAGLALFCLKHTLPGDFSLFDQNDITAFTAGQCDVRR